MQIYTLPILVGLAFWSIITPVKAQEFRNPLDIPTLLSGNFGELRSNHFHSGIDFKTQGVEGKPIHAVEEGYVSRISVSPWGYGYALYLAHPNGTTTVYGHLQRFSKRIADYVRTEQFRQESFSVNLLPEPDALPVKKGEVVALSGNTGGSGGPHLHFEVRDTETEEVLDPLEFYASHTTDTRSPRIQGLMLYPQVGKGVVNGSDKRQELKIATPKGGGQPAVTFRPEVWGEVGFALKAYDYMDNTSNVYGVKEITLLVDGETVYHSYIDRYAFHETRYLNSLTDYELWKNNRSFYMKSFVEPGNRLRFIESVNRGIVRIHEERPYQITYRVADNYGNSSSLSFTVVGKKQPIPKPDAEAVQHFHWGSDNKFGAKGVRLTIPRGNLYDDLYFRYAVREDEAALSATHTLHNCPVPLHKAVQLSLRLQHDTLDYKHQYGIVRLQGGKPSWVGGSYRSGWVDADIKELGSYTLSYDDKAPTVTPINRESWLTKRTIVLRLSDNLSGVQSYRGTIDGQFVLFEMNNKSVITCHLEPEQLTPGKHQLELSVTDGCGNEVLYRHAYTR